MFQAWDLGNTPAVQFEKPGFFGSIGESLSSLYKPGTGNQASTFMNMKPEQWGSVLGQGAAAIAGPGTWQAGVGGIGAGMNQAKIQGDLAKRKREEDLALMERMFGLIEKGQKTGTVQSPTTIAKEGQPAHPTLADPTVGLKPESIMQMFSGTPPISSFGLPTSIFGESKPASATPTANDWYSFFTGGNK